MVCLTASCPTVFSQSGLGISMSCLTLFSCSSWYGVLYAHICAHVICPDLNSWRSPWQELAWLLSSAPSLLSPERRREASGAVSGGGGPPSPACGSVSPCSSNRQDPRSEGALDMARRGGPFSRTCGHRRGYVSVWGCSTGRVMMGAMHGLIQQSP